MNIFAAHYPNIKPDTYRDQPTSTKRVDLLVSTLWPNLDSLPLLVISSGREGKGHAWALMPTNIKTLHTGIEAQDYVFVLFRQACLNLALRRNVDHKRFTGANKPLLSSSS